MTFKDLRGGQSIHEISKKLGIKENTYRKYECSVRLPAASILSQMAKVYKCDDNKVMEAYNMHKEVQIKKYGKTNP